MKEEVEENVFDELNLSLEDEMFQVESVNHGILFEGRQSISNNSIAQKSKKYQLQRPQFIIGRRRKKSSNNGSTENHNKNQRQLLDFQSSISRLSAKSRIFQPFVKDLIIKQPFLSQTQIKNMIKEELGLIISQQTVSRILDCVGYTKKRRMNTNIEGNTDENKSLRYQFAKIYQDQLDQRQLLFIDEIGFSEIIEREFGYAPIGEPLVKQKRSLKKEIVSLSVLMGFERLHEWKCLQGPPSAQDIALMLENLGEGFKEWFLLLDNAAIHKSYEIRQVCARKKIKILYFPPNSPELNPVQLFFATLKKQFRSRKYPDLKSIEEMIVRTEECCKSLQSQKFWVFKAQIICWIEKALQKKYFFNPD